MNDATLSKPLRGIIPPMVTPLQDLERLDYQGLDGLIEHILAGGVHGLFLLGTTGEGPSLSHHLRRELISHTCRQVAGRVPILVGITDTSYVESISLACHAKGVGAQAVVYAGPCYFPTSQAELLGHIERLVKDLPLPVFLYNMPSHTKVMFDVDTVRRASDIPFVLGLKDSSGSLDYFRNLCHAFADRPDFSLLMGPEELLADALAAGAHGGVCGGANLYPQLYVALYNAARAQRQAEVASLHDNILRLSDRIYQVGQYGSSYLKGLKCALSILGLCSDVMAEPFTRFCNIERDTIRKHLLDLGLLK